eukprot:3685930-Rhodomonas_salina.1
MIPAVRRGPARRSGKASQRLEKREKRQRTKPADTIKELVEQPVNWKENSAPNGGGRGVGVPEAARAGPGDRRLPQDCRSVTYQNEVLWCDVCHFVRNISTVISLVMIGTE